MKVSTYVKMRVTDLAIESEKLRSLGFQIVPLNNSNIFNPRETGLATKSEQLGFFGFQTVPPMERNKLQNSS